MRLNREVSAHHSPFAGTELDDGKLLDNRLQQLQTPMAFRMPTQAGLTLVSFPCGRESAMSVFVGYWRWEVTTPPPSTTSWTGIRHRFSTPTPVKDHGMSLLRNPHPRARVLKLNLKMWGLFGPRTRLRCTGRSRASRRAYPITPIEDMCRTTTAPTPNVDKGYHLVSGSEIHAALKSANQYSMMAKARPEVEYTGPASPAFKRTELPPRTLGRVRNRDSRSYYSSP
jgi:hypothetical protein